MIASQLDDSRIRHFTVTDDLIQAASFAIVLLDGVLFDRINSANCEV